MNIADHLLFRAYDIKGKQMIYSKNYPTLSDFWKECEKMEECSVMRCLAIASAGEKLVYEGDLLSRDYRSKRLNAQYEFVHNSTKIYKLAYWKINGQSSNGWTTTTASAYQVIANVFEHSEAQARLNPLTSLQAQEIRNRRLNKILFNYKKND